MKKYMFVALLGLFSGVASAGQYDGVWLGVMDNETSYWQLNQIGDVYALSFISIDQSDAHYRVFYGPLDNLQQVVNGDPSSSCNRDYQLEMTSDSTAILTSKNDTCGFDHSMPLNRL